jgi:hypothetical protein
MREELPPQLAPHPATVVIEGAAMAALTVGIYALGTLVLARFALSQYSAAKERAAVRKARRLFAEGKVPMLVNGNVIRKL